MRAADLLAAARRILWQTWAETGDDLASAGAQALVDQGMLVEPGGAGELERLRLLLDAQPVELSEGQLGALIEAGNGAVSDYYHERQCACSEYPAGCATNRSYRRANGYWDTDAFALGMGAVLGVWESIRTNATEAELARLRARVTELEALRPARVQTCHTCGAGYYLEHGCGICEFHELLAKRKAGEDIGERPAAESGEQPRGASEIKHPVMKPTHDHLAEHPLPSPRKDGTA
ncbi:hypothetical protein AB4225_06335 [Streptomyces sp. 2RAF24]|uniref:hypothetical protein n=1 Tax=Streptomyces sp. 2RAF24 TaxID=3232997 RepID=UPI003F9646AE